MTSYAVIECDYGLPDGTLCCTGSDQGWSTATEARRRLAKEGWARIRGEDICPEHRRAALGLEVQS